MLTDVEIERLELKCREILKENFDLFDLLDE